MAEGSAFALRRGHATICLPIEEEEYDAIVESAEEFRHWLDRCFGEMPELFPVGFPQGYTMKDGRVSAKQGKWLRRIVLRDGRSYSIRPSFLMPYMSARTEEVEAPLFLRKFGVPFWVLARLFGGDPMYWYRLETGLGRNSLVGTTVRTAELPDHVLADEHHRRRDGEKNYVATTVGGSCVGNVHQKGGRGAGLLLLLPHVVDRRGEVRGVSGGGFLVGRQVFHITRNTKRFVSCITSD